MINADDIKYSYVHKLANEYEPAFMMDDDGSMFQTMSYLGYSFLYKMHEKTFPFKYDDYIKNEDIISTIEGYGMDVESFWYAILFIYDLTQKKCVNVASYGESTRVQMEQLKDFLSGIDNFTIQANGKKKVTVNNFFVIDGIRCFLDKTLSDPDMNLDVCTMGARPADDLYSASVQMWFSATRYIELFKTLKLDNVRAKDSKVKFNKNEAVVSGGNKIVSYNKLLLISRLMYFTKLTRNENFLYSENSLKGILKQYKDFKLNTL